MLVEAFFASVRQLTDRAILKILAKSALVTLLFFVGLGFVFWWAVDWLTELLVGWMRGSLGDWAYILAYQETAATIFAAGMVLLASWLWFRAIAAALIPIFGDDVVVAVERKHYPHALVRARTIGFAEGLGLGLKSLGRTLGYNLLFLPAYIVLAFTGVGLAALLLLVNAMLLGRDFDDMMRARHGEAYGLHQPDDKMFPSLTRFLLGLVTAGILTIPLVNFLGMIIGTAMAAHMAQSRTVKEHVKAQAA
ncbi:EI24 domain-containing protein [Alterisphingorhabdus coralli]|uniref:EI24 domain-containing protein n=1 Tax=Alterisphingorhabdus coralli TaxID=3071408 RepID=A0AA97F897_9SPHN|nr:EI24 domain-containing protein [Parasphingorhabdus sp. SCSIO 66989]WOE75321.1 EI24 domain-containing protein [Parasphingorhabdus sp. SCSIO 66989]